MEAPPADERLAGPRPAPGWLAPLRGATLRTKIVIPMIALAVAPTVALGLFVLLETRASLWTSATERVRFDTGSKAVAVTAFLQAVQEDLLFLSQLRQIRELAASAAAGRTDRTAVLRRQAEEALLLFCRGRRAYYQVRFLDLTGREVVRLDVDRGRPHIVPTSQLQLKAGRYYVTETLRREPGDIYASPMDLNVEHDRIEVPHHPVVRYGTPVGGDGGQRLGIVIINFDADYVFSLLGPNPAQTEAWLTDDDGRILGYLGASDERRRRYALSAGRLLTDDYTRDQATAILGAGQVPQSIDTDEVLLSFASIPLVTGGTSRWTLLVGQARGSLEAPIRRFTIWLYVLLGLTTAMAGLLALVVADYLARPVGQLRRTIRDVAEGDLSRRVAIRTGDEIGALAHDFNSMMERLQQSRDRNAELQREVARQATRAQQLQAGLARTDKLASIGQMTAGVMHEIGNPLAAIKAKIQVTEEEGKGCPTCEALSTEVLDEVDRLSAFLRSFSRLARTPAQTFEPLQVEEIVQGVQALVAPELQRRGLALETCVPPAVPAIYGDANQLRQVLINVILNAAEAGPKRGIRIDVERGPAQGPVSITVDDDGPGIPPEDLPRVWDPFFTTKSDGTGLGLAICRQIVEAHDGTIVIDTEPGCGTAVRMSFPAAPAAPAGAGAAV